MSLQVIDIHQDVNKKTIQLTPSPEGVEATIRGVFQVDPNKNLGFTVFTDSGENEIHTSLPQVVAQFIDKDENIPKALRLYLVERVQPEDPFKHTFKRGKAKTHRMKVRRTECAICFVSITEV